MTDGNTPGGSILVTSGTVSLLGAASSYSGGTTLTAGTLIIGTDTSHVPALVRLFNDTASEGHVAGARVVAAFKGGSDDLEISYSRVDNFASQIQQYGVELVDRIPALLERVDGVLLTSVDGLKHLEQARQVIAAGKPLFIDKPLATTLEDAWEIARLAREANVPWFSTSSLRYHRIATARAARLEWIRFARLKAEEPDARRAAVDWRSSA